MILLGMILIICSVVFAVASAYCAFIFGVRTGRDEVMEEFNDVVDEALSNRVGLVWMSYTQGQLLLEPFRDEDEEEIDEINEGVAVPKLNLVPKDIV